MNGAADKDKQGNFPLTHAWEPVPSCSMQEARDAGADVGIWWVGDCEDSACSFDRGQLTIVGRFNLP
jgi:hypothetical protein